jgi:putative RNA 2'-phosphotransferase
MNNEKENKRISKFLSFVLRHKPETIHITLDDHGWTDVGILLTRMHEHGFDITREMLEDVVATNSKSRFAFNEDHSRIRASQGHSVTVDLGYNAQQPPPVLYHGTAEHIVPLILETGLEKRSRHHVHLSAETKTAAAVGQRYGKPVVLQIAALEMFNEGYKFYLADNNVWLTDHVPVKYLAVTGNL